MFVLHEDWFLKLYPVVLAAAELHINTIQVIIKRKQN